MGENYTNQFINRFGYYISMAIALITVVTFAIAIFTPPLSGPFCLQNCFQYPYHNILSRFPRDYYWMMFALLQLPIFIAFMANIHYTAVPEKKIFSFTAFGFSLLAAFVLINDYFVQLTFIQSSLLRGETEGIAVLSQYNPHGLFIVFEEVGYILMSIAFLFAAFVFQKAIRWVFLYGIIAQTLTLLLISFMYGFHNREYIFECFAILNCYLVLTVNGVNLARYYRRKALYLQ